MADGERARALGARLLITVTTVKDWGLQLEIERMLLEKISRCGCTYKQ